MLKRQPVGPVFGIVLAILIGFGAGGLALRTPPRPECKKSSAKYDHKEKHCELSESLWEKTESDPVALFTGGLLVFTAILAGIGLGQGVLIFRQIRLAREEFTASHRPRIKVRRIRLTDPFHHVRNPSFASGSAIGIDITIVNVGDIRANSVSGKCHLLFCCGPLTIPEITSGVEDVFMSKPGNFDVGVSQKHTYSSRSSSSKYGVDSTEIRRLNEGWRLVIRGEIEYTDSSGRIRYTGFLRELNEDSNGRFLPSDNPEYEYED